MSAFHLGFGLQTSWPAAGLLTLEIGFSVIRISATASGEEFVLGSSNPSPNADRGVASGEEGGCEGVRGMVEDEDMERGAAHLKILVQYCE